jgi:dihydroneopterin aldolase
MSTTLLLDPRLSDCRRIFLREVVVDANIGIHAFEKQGPQKLVINIDLFVPLALSTPIHDKIHEVLDYDFVRSTVRKRIDAGHINLQETLVDDLARARRVPKGARAARGPGRPPASPAG